MTKQSKKSEFFCPVSPHIAWSWRLIFKECPVVASERDSEECRTCPLRGVVPPHGERSRPKRDMSDKRKKSAGTHTDRTTPKKGQTFVG
jgi:hypothetical protein